MNRRDALEIFGLTSLAALTSCGRAVVTDLSERHAQAAQPETQLERGNSISLAQWSLHRRFGLGRPEERVKDPSDPMDFAKIAREEFGIKQVEYVNSFYRARIGEKNFGAELRKRCDDVGSTSVLIMCDGEGLCGAADESARATFAKNHVRWLELAQVLGCHSIRVNAIGEGAADEQLIRCADGLDKLLAVAKPFGINVIVENHGGLSSDGSWVVRVMQLVGDQRSCGTLPDFGNWRDASGVLIDPVKNVGLVLPYAKGVSAKSYDFDEEGRETLLDYAAIMGLVAKSSYRGPIGIEYEGKRLSEHDGILATKSLLERFGCKA